MATVLDREMYTEAEAGRLLGVPKSTLHYWLEGDAKRDYSPIIRQAPQGTRTVTWAEFIEAGMLRQYRQIHRVRMPELRRFIEQLRDAFGVPYPLAHKRPFVSGRNLVYDAQEKAGLGDDLCLVVVGREGEPMLLPPSQSFLERVEWDGDIAGGWRPDPTPDSPVLINPSMRFGRPAVHGISTEALWEQEQAGEDVASIAETYGLTEQEVRRAIGYEYSHRAA